MAQQSTLNYITQGLVNLKNSAGGPSIPPKQSGQFQIPFVSNLRVGPSSRYFGGTQYTLLWDEPTNTTNVSHYNVYVVGALQNNQTPLGPYSSERSPAVFRVTASAASLLTFFVQTQLNNGNVSDLAFSPSCTAQVTIPQIQNGDVMAGITIPGLALSDFFAGSTFFTVSNSTSALFVDTTLGSVTVTAPSAPSEGQLLILKKVDSSANSVTLVANTGQTVESGATFSNALGAMTFIYRTVAASLASSVKMWQILSKY